MAVAKEIEFGLKAVEPERIIGFYKRCFGWDFDPDPRVTNRWIITTGRFSKPGMYGHLIQVLPPQEYDTIVLIGCTIEVISIDETESLVIDNGGTILIPMQSVPGGGRQFFAQDPDKNFLTVKQTDPLAGPSA